jgi:hypothetical protein
MVVVGAPVSTSLPALTGRSMEGETLTATPGGWTGIGPIGFTYQWTRCNAKGEFPSCVPIRVSSSSTYTMIRADVGHRLFVQVKAQNRFGASFVNSAQTPVVQAAPTGTMTIRAPRKTVVYGSALTLVGGLVGVRPGEPVTLVESPFARAPLTRPNAAVTTAAGTWAYRVRPIVQTAYRAQISGRTSDPVTVSVRPRLRFGRIAPGRYSLRVYAARSFAGRFAVLQQWNPRRHRWVNTRRLYLKATGLGVQPTVVSATTVRIRVRRGLLFRVVLPAGQAAPGYLNGTSNRIRT